jgi:hypothetical protein
MRVRNRSGYGVETRATVWLRWRCVRCHGERKATHEDRFGNLLLTFAGSTRERFVERALD